MHDPQQPVGRLRAASSRRAALLAAGSIASSAAVLAWRSAGAQNSLTSAATGATARRAISVINQALASGDMTILDTVFASDYINHTPHRSLVSGQLFSPDLAGLKASLSELRRLVPDAVIVVDDIIAAGDTAAVLWTLSGTRDPAGGNGPRQRVRLGGVSIARTVDGRVVESWAYHEGAEGLDPRATAVAEQPETDDGRGQTRALPDIEAVALHGVGTLVIEQGETASLTIEAAPKVLRRIETRVVNGTLIIEPDRSFTTRVPITYHLTVDQINRIELAGAGQVTADQLSSDELSLQLSGAASASIADLTADELEVTASGNAEVALAGTVEGQTVTLSGTASYDAATLDSHVASVAVAGASEATVRVRDRLEARVREAGTIAYLGNPQVSKEVSLAGTLTKIGEPD